MNIPIKTFYVLMAIAALIAPNVAGGSRAAAPASPAAAPSKQDTPAVAGMPTTGAPAGSASSSTGPGYGPDGPGGGAVDDMTGMSMSGMKMGSSMSGMEEMTPLKMPRLKEQGSYTVTGSENWKVRTGFGKNAGMVGMMTRMMVGGSGMEGMKMPAMKMNFDQANFTENPDDEVAASGTTAPPMSGSMPGMDVGAGMKMGGGEPAAQMPVAHGAAPTPEATPAKPQETMSNAASGKPIDPMPGMAMPAAPRTTPLKITASIAAPKSGDNAVTITVADAAGVPVTGATITASVAMTSMDMGTTHPPVKEIGGGKYHATATFSMAGPWRVTVKVTPSGGGAPQKAAFDFTAK